MEAYRKLLVIVALFLAGAIGSDTLMANSDQSFCRMTKEGLNACAPSVNGANPQPPSALCCTALSYADFGCLCLFKKYSNFLSAYGIDPNLAMQLPAKCNFGQPIRC
ncbi:putative lipid-transfer protein DIR1 [Pyrus communis]|uniref:putative lipid-transfer protein DIR1 n=1 Tax=Pyrus communis TaxID=23211 RepID=UPI0035C09DB7